MTDISKSMRVIIDLVTFTEKKPTIFISHKHSDFNELKDDIGFLEKEYDVLGCIDSNVPSMPKMISEEIVKCIKKSIKKNNKFILLVTNGAINSKLCDCKIEFGNSQN